MEPIWVSVARAFVGLRLHAGATGARDPQWSGEGSFDGPSSSESIHDCAERETDALSPTCRRVLNAAHFNDSTVARVYGLLSLGGPTTVARLVIAIVVVAFNRMASSGLRTHISHERLERIDPLRTNLDSSAAVVLELGRLGIQAAPLHGAPRSVGRRFAEAVRAMDVAGQNDKLAAARYASTVTPLRDCDVRSLTTVTSALPSAALTIVTQGRQVAEALAGDVGLYPHKRILLHA